MKIAILTASSPQKASGILAVDLMNGFLKNGHDCIIITNYYIKSDNKNIISLTNYFQSIFSKVYRLLYKKKNKFLNKFNKQYYIQDINQTKSNLFAKRILKNLPFKPDAFIYLFPQYFLNTRDLHLLNQKTQAPVLWYMMDMAPMTGGCHYAWDCKGYTGSCGRCPALFSDSPFDQTYKNMEFKKKYIDQANIIPIAGTEWQLNQLQKSSVFQNNKKYKVLLPIDDDIFKPNSKSEVRKSFGLPQKKKVILFGAVTTTEKRKGFHELIKALDILKNQLDEKTAELVHVAIVGNSNDKLKSTIPFNCTFLGYLSKERLASAYQVADVFVSPSIEDSGPMMVNQAIMSGTPVVAFEIGVALDLIIDGETGYKAKLKDSGELADGIKNVLELKEPESIKMSQNCRNLGLKMCDTKKQMERFIEIITDNRTFE